MAFSSVECSPESNSSVLQSAMKALKLIFLSVGLIFTLLIPCSCEIVFSNLVGFWNFFKCFFSSPLYICIIINSMVLLIAASTTLLSHETDNHGYDIKSTIDEDNDILTSESHLVSPPPIYLPRDVTGITSQPPCRDVTEVETPPPETLLSRIEKCSTSTFFQCADHEDYTHILHYSAAQDCVRKTNVPSPDESVMLEDRAIKKTAYPFFEGEMVKTNPTSDSKKNGLSTEMEAEMANNQSDEKQNEEDDTMEATWKAITGFKRKQLQKSETWTPRSTAAAQSLHAEKLPSSTVSWKDLKKSQTFDESVSIRRIGGLRRDPSVGIDEFNQKVEAFIKKFNDEMRLQRQESDHRFLDMIKRGL